jgi:type I restriction enzyme, S subunit
LLTNLGGCILSKVKLGDIADIVTGPFGSMLHKKDYVSIGTPVIMPQDIGDRTLSLDEIAHIGPEDAARLARYATVENDIVYARRGDVEKHAFIDANTAGALCGTGCLRVRVDARKADPLFVSFYLNRPESRTWIRQHAVGSNMPNINTDILSDLPLDLPDKGLQRRTGLLLKTIDDKIENNRKLMAELETTARLVYDEWFVRFDFPDVDGRPYRSSGGAMAWNDKLKHEIPAGWKARTFGSLVSCNERQFAELPESILYLDTSGLTNNNLADYQVLNRREEFPSRAKRPVKDNDILFSTVRPDQCHFGMLKHVAPNVVVSTGFAVITSRVGARFSSVLYLFLTQKAVLKYLQAIAISSTSSYPSIDPSDILNLEVAVPQNMDEIGALADYLDLLYEYRWTLQSQNHELQYLRNFLLPMLMNGQVRVE